MNTVVSVEVINPDALDLLKKLEQLKLIKVDFKPQKRDASDVEKLFGGWSEETGDRFETYLKETRSEWERSTY